ncbi:MAG: hypothetical protein QOI31_2498 [Solirubrobacterales bacterium]|jgi:hypothetical protein|nr:hypothetical protein [Solirubrobacterales bacterium]
MKPEDWIAEFAAAIGAEPPDAAIVEELLDLAAIAAHASERTAAPIACYLAGLSGRPIAELKDLADDVAPSD